MNEPSAMLNPTATAGRFVQGKRVGREITLFSLWYELRWGITAGVLLTLSLITVIFYFHPSTSSAISYFRTVPVLPESIGRVAEVFVGLREEVEAGTPLFRLDSSEQQAAVESARRRIVEAEAALDESPDLGTFNRVVLHVIDGVGVVHAAILRLQAILLPVRTLVLSGGH